MTIKNTVTIFKREIKAYFNSPIAYIFIIVFLFISVGLFMTQFFIVSLADMRGFFYYMPMILSVFLPAVAMRLWAEERRGNTLELLLTFPMKTHELVLGKFLASLLFYALALLATFPLPLMLIVLGNPDMGVIICQYLGTFLMGGFFLALGIFISGLCRDQIVSFIMAMMACFVFFLLGVDFVASSIDSWIGGFGTFLRSTLGMTQHYLSFQKGVIDTRDILYFLMGATIFLVLNGFWLEGRLRPKAKTIFTTASLICLGIFTLFNFIFNDIVLGRFDWTEGKIYTVSEASREILKNLKAPVLVKLFVSSPDKMPTGFKTLERDIRDKLDELKVVSAGKFSYKIFHMDVSNVTAEEGEESLERSIERKGIRPFQVRSIEADEVGVKLIYAALSIAYKEKAEEIIPRVSPSDIPDLEYQLISKIYKMTLPTQPHIALVAPYEERAVDPQMREVLKALGQEGREQFREDEYELVPRILRYEGYKVSRIQLTQKEPLPPDATTLVVIEPTELNERQKFEINKFLVEGGAVFLAVQNYIFNYAPVGRGGVNVSAIQKKPGVNSLLKEWGLGVDEMFLMDKQLDIISLSGGRLFGVFEVSSPVKLPIQIKVIPEQMNHKVSLTSHLSPFLYLWGSALTLDEEKLESAGLTHEVLFTSSPYAWKSSYHPGPLKPQDIMPPLGADTYEQVPLAVLVEGEFPNAFKGRTPPRWPAESGKESYEKQPESIAGSEPGKLILTGCAAMFNRQLLDKGGHLNFFLNAIDTLALGGKLVEVRSKQPIDRSLKRISGGARAGWRVFVTFFVPAILCVVGGARLILRKRSKWQYLKMLKAG